MPANVDKMMYVGEKPWHGEGTKLDSIATSAEAIEAAELDWKVAKEQIYIKRERKEISVEGKYATVRTDRNIALGVVGKVYRPLQNKEAFSFFDAVVGEKAAMYHTAGSLDVGERVWILAKLPGNIKVVGDDVVDKYLLLANSHDGTSAVQMMFTPIRVVCQNTLNMAISEAVEGKRIKLRHTLELGEKVKDVKKQLGIMNYQYSLFETLSQNLTKVEMNQKLFIEYLEKIGIVVKDEEGQYSTRAQNNINMMVKLFEHGKGNDLPGVKGTAWAGFNAIVEYVDYIRGSDKNRTESILYGSGADIKQKAWDLVTAGM